MEKKKIRNPLFKRIPKELIGDWKKYLVVSLFLILTIGSVSGMYVANGSMMQEIDESGTKYKLEDGHFELNKKADKELLSAIETGDKADVKQYYLDKAKSELEKEFESEFTKEFDEQFQEQVKQTLLAQGMDEAMAETMLSDAVEQAKQEKSYQSAYDKAYSEAYDEAWDEVKKEIDEKYEDAVDKYELDDDDFVKTPVSLYENFYRNEEEDNDNDGTSDATIRVYQQTNEINLACLMEGHFPENENEIAVDRLHADTAGFQVGDTITVGGQSYEVVGLIAYVNYSTLHEKSTDMMLDSLKFDVAMVTEDGFDRLGKSIHYAYAWTYDSTPADDIEEKQKSDDFMKALLTQTVVADDELEDYVPRYANPAINFATEDMGSDVAMSGVLLDILIIVIAFVFAITISNTIAKESSTIGTLRALGYTKGELICHYLSMPVIVTLVSAVIGNVLGYTEFKNVVASMYYSSYSLPTFETVWNGEAFYKTTLIPIVLILVVDLFMINKMMQHTPLQFLRHDLKKTKRKKAMRLPSWSFLCRFRLRIIFQNVPNYIILFAGILFVEILLAMAVGMPSALNYYSENAVDMMFAKYQYILTDYEDDDGNKIVTKNEDAEEFSMCSLLRKGGEIDEEVSVYGISDDSHYVIIDDLVGLDENEVYISEPFSEKYDVTVGDTISLDEKYENKSYSFTVVGIYDKSLNLDVYMPLTQYRSVFDVEDDAFTGYMSDTEVTDIEEEDIATVITEEDTTKIIDQLFRSMGSYMSYFQVVCVFVAAVIIYLLTKIIIEKNETAISMTKVLGYENGEIASLYLLSTTIVVVLATAISVVLGAWVMVLVWKVMMQGFNGWLDFLIQPVGYIKMFVFVLISYVIVMFLDFRRIKKIPMDEALKNVE
jgi:putative ABC transport system permease protein